MLWNVNTPSNTGSWHKALVWFRLWLRLSQQVLAEIKQNSHERPASSWVVRACATFYGYRFRTILTGVPEVRQPLGSRPCGGAGAHLLLLSLWQGGVGSCWLSPLPGEGRGLEWGSFPPWAKGILGLLARRQEADGSKQEWSRPTERGQRVMGQGEGRGMSHSSSFSWEERPWWWLSLCLLFHHLFLFSDDSLLQAFHFNDGVAVKPSHTKAWRLPAAICNEM